jgi:hypothetical protein
MEKVKRTTEVSSNIGRGCEHCREPIGSLHNSDDITESVNHYIEKHGYRLLHVGTQTSHDTNSKPWHSTVAILGHDAPPAILPPSEIHIGDVPSIGFKPKPK